MQPRRLTNPDAGRACFDPVDPDLPAPGRLGEPVHYQHVPGDLLRSLPVPGADIAGNMFQFVTEQNDAFCAPRDTSLARSLNPGLASFAEWVEATRRRMPVSAESR